MLKFEITYYKLIEKEKEMFDENYICKIPTIEEIHQRLEYENDEQENQKIIQDVESQKSITYYGILNGTIISEATAAIRNDSYYVKNPKKLINKNTAYLSAFKTQTQYRNSGFFSRLFDYMIDDLRNRGFAKFTVGVEKDNYLNKSIYLKYGFTKFIKSQIIEYPNGQKNEVEYYLKSI